MKTVMGCAKSVNRRGLSVVEAALLTDNIHSRYYIPGQGIVGQPGRHFEAEVTWLDAERILRAQMLGQLGAELQAQPQEPVTVIKSKTRFVIDVLSGFIGQCQVTIRTLLRRIVQQFRIWCVLCSDDVTEFLDQVPGTDS